MKGKLLLSIGIAALVLLSGCPTPTGPNIEDVVTTCREQGGDICNADEVCRGSIIRASDSYYCCNIACEEITEDECQTGADCDDGDSSTADMCSRTPKRCFNIVKTCSGDIYGNRICTAHLPPREDPCAGVNCPSNQRCVDGECVPIQE